MTVVQHCTDSRFEWLDDFEELFSCARFVVVAMMSVDCISNNVVPDDKIAFFLGDPRTSNFCKIFRDFLLFGLNSRSPSEKYFHASRFCIGYFATLIARSNHEAPITNTID